MSDLKVDGIIASTGTNTALTLQGKGSGKVAIGDGALLFPDADGSDGQFIKTDGSAALSFAAAGGGIVLQAVNMAIAEGSGTDEIPMDDTAPLVSEGAQIGSQAIVMADDSNKVLIIGAIQALNDGADSAIAIAVFRGSTCISTRARKNTGTNHDGNIPFAILDSPATEGSVTYSLRAGREAATGNWEVGVTLNGYDFGDLADDGLILLEISA
jgi:hypothetical protein